MPRMHLFLLGALVLSTATLLDTRFGPGSARTTRALPGKPPLQVLSRPAEPRLEACETATAIWGIELAFERGRIERELDVAYSLIDEYREKYGDIDASDK